MFQIINSFIEGELTDKQCKHCLAATNLGMQYIFVSEKAVSQAKLIVTVFSKAVSHPKTSAIFGNREKRERNALYSRA